MLKRDAKTEPGLTGEQEPAVDESAELLDGFSDREPRVPRLHDSDEAALRGRAILVVDDDVSLLRVCERMLKSLEYRVITTHLPEEALEIVESGKEELDLLLTDVIMPKMNGVQLSRRVGAVAPQLKCLFMSGSTFDALKTEAGVPDPPVDILQKPFTKEELARKVREALNSNRNSVL